MCEKKIPPIIHYCWFGKGEKSPEILKCIASWKEHLPEYEIVEWNEEKFDIASAVPYVKEAYENKKWAFVSDYVRLYALYIMGGIYLDTDVQVLKSFDPLRIHEAFLGFEAKDYLGTSMIAAVPGHWMVKEFLDSYAQRHFVRPNGTLDTETTNVVAITQLLSTHGLRRNGKSQNVQGIEVYPQRFFSDNCLYNLFGRYRKASYSYHHYQASWYKQAANQGWKKRIRYYLLGKARNLLGTDTLYRLKHRR